MVADCVEPRLGMEKALLSLLQKLPHDMVELVVISGPAPVNVPYKVTLLDRERGWRGRISARKQLREIFRSRGRKNSILVAVGSWSYLALVVATIGAPRRIILWEHTLLPWRVWNEFRVSLTAAALRIASFRLGAVVCVSKSNCAMVSKLVWPNAKLFVIPNITSTSKPIASPQNRPQIQLRSQIGEDVLILGVGSLSKRKNWSLAIRAMVYLPSNFRLQIAGAGSEFASLKGLIEELDLSDRVELLGYVAEAGGLMSEVDIVLHPSLAETFGYTMIEAAVSRRPVVVLDKAAMNELVPSFVCGELAELEPAVLAKAVLRASCQDYDFAGTERARSRVYGDEAIVTAWVELANHFQ